LIVESTLKVPRGVIRALGVCKEWRGNSLAKVMEKLCGFQVSSTQVSKPTAELDIEFKKWCNRTLPGIIYLTLDATYYKVRIDGTVRDCATLIAIGVRREDGKRMILDMSCALSEAEVHWREFADSLRERGMGIPDLVTSDAHTGLRAALRACFAATLWQRCQFHPNEAEAIRWMYDFDLFHDDPEKGLGVRSERILRAVGDGLATVAIVLQAEDDCLNRSGTFIVAPSDQIMGNFNPL